MSASEIPLQIPLLQTPLHDLHLSLGARMVPFAGYLMPVQYPAGLMAEHLHTRAAAGLFDVSHMGQLRLVGSDAAAAFETLIPMDVIDLPVGKQRYGLLLNDAGGIIDDLMFVNRDYANGGREPHEVGNFGGEMSADGPPLGAKAPPGLSAAAPGLPSQAWTARRDVASGIGLYREPHEVGNRGGDIFVIVNGACKAADFAHIQSKIGTRCHVIPMPEMALMALQGPQAVTVLQRLCPGIDKLVFMTGGKFNIACDRHGKHQAIACFVTRSGYTGEDGFEISVHGTQAEALARALLAQPEVKPVGLGARNSLRLEAGLCLYGNDIDSITTPVEAGLTWAMQKVRRIGGAREGGFPGATKILAQLVDTTGSTGHFSSKITRKRVGLMALERIPVRDHSELQNMAGQGIGEVTSGLLAPSIDQPVAMGYVTPEFAALGTKINAIVRGRRVPMEVVAMPFAPSRYFRG